MKFAEIIGQQDMKGHMQNAIARGKTSHAYIISGEKDSGKMMLAEAFAATLLCEDHGVDACGQCHSCLQAEGHNHPDIRYITHDKPNTITVDDIRVQLNNDIVIKPYSSDYKVYIMDEAEKMNTQAQNALLKTIEEPPAYAIIFLLTTNAAGFLPTILSRCVTLEVQPVSQDLITKELMANHSMPDYQAKVCAQFSQGNLGKAIKLASSEEFNEMRSHMTALMRRMEKMDAYELSVAQKELEGYKPQIQDYLDLMNIYFRDVLLYKATGQDHRLIFQDEKMVIHRQAAALDFSNINALLEAVSTAKRRIKLNGNFSLAIELLLFSIKENIT